MTTPVFVEPYGATPLDPDEREGLMIPVITTREQLNEVESANIEQGVRWLARQRSVDVLTDVFLYTLHRRLFGDVWRLAGHSRR